MTRVVIVKPHTPTYADPISFLQGERVEVQKPDSEYPNWHWCRNHAGKVGWVHASFLAAITAQTVGARNYSALELTVRSGEEVMVLEQLDGWLYVRLNSGGQGWIPESCVGPAAS